MERPTDHPPEPSDLPPHTAGQDFQPLPLLPDIHDAQGFGPIRLSQGDANSYRRPGAGRWANPPLHQGAPGPEQEYPQDATNSPAGSTVPPGASVADHRPVVNELNNHGYTGAPSNQEPLSEAESTKPEASTSGNVPPTELPPAPPAAGEFPEEEGENRTTPPLEATQGGDNESRKRLLVHALLEGKPLVSIGENNHYNSVGDKTGVEYAYQAGEEELVAYYKTFDADGSETNRFIESSGFRIGGAGVLVERDEQQRPLKVAGFENDSGIVGAVTNAVFGPEDGDSHPDMPKVGPYREFVFEYDDTGLLTAVTETYRGREDGTDGIKTRHQNFYNDDGTHSGYLKSDLVDVVGEQEIYEVTEARLLEIGQTRWRETQYKGLQGGLVPVHLKEGFIDGPATEFGIEWPQNPEELPFLVKRSEAMELHRLDGYGRLVTNLGNRFRWLPSFIPEDSIPDVLSGRVTPHDASIMPNFPETETKEDILTLEEAIRTPLAETDESFLARGLNDLAEQRVAVIHTMLKGRSGEAVMYQTMRAAPHLTDSQKLTLAGTLHPAFTRQDLIPSGEFENLAQNNDKWYLENVVTRLLNTSVEALQQEFERLSDQLGVEARRRFTYLFTAGRGVQ